MEESAGVASTSGDLEALQQLQRWQQQGYAWQDEGICAHAAHNGHLAVLQWAQLHGCPINVHDCVQKAHKKHHWGVVWWLHGRFPDDVLLPEGVRHLHLALLALSLPDLVEMVLVYL